MHFARVIPYSFARATTKGKHGPLPGSNLDQTHKQNPLTIISCCSHNKQRSLRLN